MKVGSEYFSLSLFLSNKSIGTAGGRCSCFKCAQSLGTLALFSLSFSLSPRLSRVNRQNLFSLSLGARRQNWCWFCVVLTLLLTARKRQKKKNKKKVCQNFNFCTDRPTVSEDKPTDSSFFCMKRGFFSLSLSHSTRVDHWIFFLLLIRNSATRGKGHVQLLLVLKEANQKCQFVVVVVKESGGSSLQVQITGANSPPNLISGGESSKNAMHCCEWALK